MTTVTRARTQTIRVPQWAFFGDTELELPLPAEWEVVMRPMPGADLPPLSDDEIRAALASPIGTPPLREMARGRKEAVIIFDDISRPTPVERLWPFVVEELHAAGLDDDHIRFIVALGTHAAHSREDLRRKLGEEALRRFPVYNHNPYQHCTCVGTTPRGTPVEVNDEVLACDLRIAIGSVLPHPSMGFGGGPKIILPGVVSFETIRVHHNELMPRLVQEGYRDALQAGEAENPAWRDIADSARLAGLDFIVNSLLNQRRGVVDLVAGDVVAAWRVGVERARGIYATEPVADADIAVTNGYGKGNEAMISAFSPYLGYGAEDGGRDVVAINNCPQGMVVHYLNGDFGPATFRTRAQRKRGLPKGVGRMIVYSPFPERSSRRFFRGIVEPHHVSSWEDTLELLASWHPGAARVAVYPDLTVQYLAPNKRDGDQDR